MLFAPLLLEIVVICQHGWTDDDAVGGRQLFVVAVNVMGGIGFIWNGVLRGSIVARPAQ